MDDQGPVRFTELTDSDIYSLRRNEITVLNGCVIGIIYIKVTSMKFKYKWSKRYIIIYKNKILIYKPKTKNENKKSVLLKKLKITGITMEDDKITFEIKNISNNRTKYRIGSKNHFGILNLYNYLDMAIKKLRLASEYKK